MKQETQELDFDLMRDQVVSFETAKLAFEKGFDLDGTTFYVREDCTTGHSSWNKKKFKGEQFIDEAEWMDETCCPIHNLVSDQIYEAPTQSFLQKWLREKFQIMAHVSIEWGYAYDEWEYGAEVNYLAEMYHSNEASNNEPFKTYEEALERALKDALELL